MAKSPRTDSDRGEHWVLVSDGADAGTRDCVVAIRALAQAGYNVAVTVRSPRAVLSRYVGRRVLVEDDIAAGSGERWTAVPIPHSSPPARRWSSRWMLKCQPCLDKVATSRRARGTRITVPEEMVFEKPGDLAAAAHTLRYPVVVKPAVRTFKAFRADPRG